MPTPIADRFPTSVEGLPAACPPEIVELDDGDEFELRITPVAKRVGDTTVRMLAYNGSVPGPTLKVPEGATITVHVDNQGDLPTTVHWHGLRLDNRYDGTPDTQRPVQVGQRYTARVHTPDAGVYWYHPHIREDYGQELGLYGNVVVEPADPGYWPPAHREVALTLDDLLLEDGRIAPFHRSTTTHSAMGRYGDVLLVAGETDLVLDARPGEIVRLHLTNTANTRVFDVALPGAQLKLVGGDSGRVEHEVLVDHVVVAPSERVTVDAGFGSPGELALEHRTPDRVHRLATVRVAGDPAEPALADDFLALRTSAELAAQRRRIEPHLVTAPDKVLAFLAEMDMGDDDHPDHDHPGHDHHDAVGHGGHGGHDHATGGADGIEWDDHMAEANRLTTPDNFRWLLVDRATGAANEAIDWQFRVGDQVKIRLVNELAGDHPMHHPFHVHGAGRFLVLSRDGTPEANLAWKDTVLVRTGETVDILLDVTNPGRWMAHCHIAEHHETGMMLAFTVVPARAVPRPEPI
jgi:FtsP/CotA-like multicopper oxidase with cupredoxin domain